MEVAMIPHLSLPDEVHLTLKRRILNNELTSGERLVESNLAAEFGVSRTTLRSALRELKNEGLVEITPRRGCFVARMSQAEVEDACYARYLLEAGAICEATSKVDESLLSSVDKELHEMQAAAAAGDVAAIIEVDTRLHGLIVEAGGRARVSDLWHALDAQMGSLMRSSLDRQDIDLFEAVDRHRVLLEALRTRRRSVIERAIKDHYVDPPPSIKQGVGANSSSTDAPVPRRGRTRGRAPKS
jgi:DNA-binding GntR family transcriptional regulator